MENFLTIYLYQIKNGNRSTSPEPVRGWGSARGAAASVARRGKGQRRWRGLSPYLHPLSFQKALAGAFWSETPLKEKARGANGAAPFRD